MDLTKLRAVEDDEDLRAGRDETKAKCRRLQEDRIKAIESFAREAKESMLEDCAEAQQGLSYLAAFDVIEFLAGAISRDRQS